MAKLSAHGNTVLDRFTVGDSKYVFRSDNKVLRGLNGSYTILQGLPLQDNPFKEWETFKVTCKAYAKVADLKFIDGK